MSKKENEKYENSKLNDLKIRDQAEVYCRLFENSIDGFALQEMVLDHNGSCVDYRFIEVNYAFEELLNLEKGHILGRSIKEILPGSENTLIKKYKQVSKEGNPTRFEHYCQKLNKYFEITTFNPDKDIYFSIFRDISAQKKTETEIKKSLQEKELLLREIHHRVKNNLAMVSSLLNIQKSYIEDKKAKIAFIESRKRINSIALIHEKLYLSNDLARIEFKQYISDLINILIKSYSIPTELLEVNIDIAEIFLNIDESIPLGLIITELVTNSLKYGYRDQQKLTLSISLKENKNQLSLLVSDNGVGIPADLDWRNTETLGIQLVILLTSQLKGDIQLDRTQGTSFRIIFPRLKEESI